jgi:flagellar protein FliS
MSNPIQTYRNTAIQTADRGKLVVMVYDYCINWCDKAVECENASDMAGKLSAISKVQSGITELTCALDMEKGGDIARNLWRIYDFMMWYLSQAMRSGQIDKVDKVRVLLDELRGAWVVAAENVRKSDASILSGSPRGIAISV